jgi:hypothetical protein
MAPCGPHGPMACCGSLQPLVAPHDPTWAVIGPHDQARQLVAPRGFSWPFPAPLEVCLLLLI